MPGSIIVDSMIRNSAFRPGAEMRAKAYPTRPLVKVDVPSVIASRMSEFRPNFQKSIMVTAYLKFSG